MKKRLIILALILFGASQMFAQDQVDALRFSQRFLQGDARSVGIGNAIGAVGADFNSSTINPAGLGLFRKSEFKFSLGFYDINSQGTYLGQLSQRHKFNVNVPDFSIVLSKVNKVAGKPVKDGWANWAFGMGLNRTNNFHSRREFRGINDDNSILDYYVERANGQSIDQFYENTFEGMAYDAYLIDPHPGNPNQYIRVFDTGRKSDLNLLQTNSITTRGSSYDLNFSFGANYSNKFYVGGTVGIPIINFHLNREFSEENTNDDIKRYYSSSYSDELDISGIGIQGTFGLIVRPSKYVRIGASIQSPAYYSMSEEYSSSISSHVLVEDTNGNFIDSRFTKPDDIAIGLNDYEFVSPFKATASIAFFAGKHGFISFDYEFVDYAAAYFMADLYSYSDINLDIAEYYEGAHNIRVGAELRYSIFSFRGGYGMYGSPYNSMYKPSEADASTKVVSVGLGMREKSYFLDIAYQLSKRKEFYLPYNLKNSNVEGAIEDLSATNVVLTFGLRF